MHVAQQKTKAKLLIPLHPRLKELLAVWPRDQMVILSTSTASRSRRPASATGWPTRSRRPGYLITASRMGLRKAAARLLAEAGCTTHQIMAVTGHKSLSEVERYTKAAQQKRLAQEAFKQLGDEAGT
jgi:integrase